MEKETYLGYGYLQANAEIFPSEGRGRVKHCVESASIPTLGGNTFATGGETLQVMKKGLPVSLLFLV
jgi:hypothetical protein